MMPESTLTFCCDNTRNFKHLKYRFKTSKTSSHYNYFLSELNLEGNSIGWVAKSFIVISKIHFLWSHWMSTTVWFSFNFSQSRCPFRWTYLVQPPRQAPRLILSPLMSWLGPTIPIDLELCWRILAILFSSRLTDIIIGTTWHGDLQLPFLRFRRIKGFSVRAFGETFKIDLNLLKEKIEILPVVRKKLLGRRHLIRSSKHIESNSANY